MARQLQYGYRIVVDDAYSEVSVAFDFSRWSLRTLFHFKSKVRGEPVTRHRVTNPYHAVSIVTGAKACARAQQLEGKRFLSAEAPRLPLPGCNVSTCKCHYLHHEDRRSGEPRRESDLGIIKMEGIWRGVERRSRRGRRQEDK